MEPQQYQQQQQQINEDGGNGSSSKSSFLCRQSTTRWIPTTDQIRILKDLYYNNGIRSPSAEQIQRISGRLRQYGKIEGKNVFYWFQNHKARERQKKRFSLDAATIQRGWKPEDFIPNKYSNMGYSPSSSSSSFAVGQMGSNGCSSLLMEKRFTQECSISGGGGGYVGSNLGWVGMESAETPYGGFGMRRWGESLGREDSHVQTLPLFPMHGEDNSCNSGNTVLSVGKPDRPDDYFSGWYVEDEDKNGTSLELTLDSYSGGGLTDPTWPGC